MSKVQHIIQQLSTVPGHKLMEKSSMIKCPYHTDNTPSMRVWHRSGLSVCYGCKTQVKFDELAARMGLAPYVHNPMTPARAHKLMVAKPKKSDANYDEDQLSHYTLSKLPENKVWRGFPTEFLTEVGCKLLTTEYNTKFIYMPVYVQGELRGFSRARLKKESDKPSYLHVKGAWSKTEGLFPFDYAIKLMKKNRLKTLVLVEGQRDALRLLYQGIPAVCILGTNSWTDEKARLLEIAGVQTAIPFMDGDESGIDATHLLKSSIAKYCRVEPIMLWRVKGNPYPEWIKQDEETKRATKGTLWDPFNCPQTVIDKLKTKVYRNRK